MRSKIVIMLFTATLFAGQVSADHILVCGDVSGIWSVDTVIVTCEIRVPQGNTLTIEPGVVVLFQTYCKCVIETSSQLNAIGTESEMIEFDEMFAGNGWHGIRFLSSSDSSRLEYCHLKNGLATGDDDDEYGGAVYCNNSSPSILNCRIDSCFAERGGGIYCRNNSNPLITGNRIRWNEANNMGGGICCSENSNPMINSNIIHQNRGHDGAGIACFQSNPQIIANIIGENQNSGSSPRGAGIYCDDSSPVITGDSIIYNGSSGGRGIYCRDNTNATITENAIIGNSGGGIYCSGSSNLIRYNYIGDNESLGDGGGIFIGGSNSTATITLNYIRGNSSDDGGGIALDRAYAVIDSNYIYNNSSEDFGGGVYCDECSSSFSHNVIVNNISSDVGGGIYFIESYVNLDHNTIVYNQSANNGSALYMDDSDAEVKNTIIYFNQPLSQHIRQTNGTTVQITYSDIEGGWHIPDSTNIDCDPVFCDYYSDVFFIDSSSCCVGAGQNGSTIGALPAANCPQLEVSDHTPLIPADYLLYQNYPNPFNALTIIEFTIAEPQDIMLTVYDLLGRQIQTIMDEYRQAGTHIVSFDAFDLPSGVYFYRLQAGNVVETKRMVLLK